MADKDRVDEGRQEEGLLGRTVSRRQFLKVAGVAGAAVGMGAGLGGLLAACGGEETTTTSAATGGTTVTTAAPSGGTGRAIKIGFVTPLTGAISNFGIPDKYCADRATEALKDGLVCGDGKTHPVSIIVRDSQSDSNRASTVTGDLINNDQVDLIVTASTPETVVPVADTAETYGVPCVSTDCPWQPYVDRTNVGDFSVVYKWNYHTFWGLEDVQANFLDMWNQVATNKQVGAMWSNDADGQAWKSGWNAVWPTSGYTATTPGDFQIGTEDYSAQLSQFKKAGCEVGVGLFQPPDFTTFWKQASQQGWKPKVASYGKALLFPESLTALGSIGEGLTTEVWWMASHPFKSSLLGETCQQFADEYTKRTGGQWTQPLLHFIIFDWAADVLKRTTNVDDKETIIAAVKSTKLDTIGGHIDFTAPVEPAGPPWTPGPGHVVENVYKTPQVGGQWRKGTTYPFELTCVSTAAIPADLNLGIKATDKVQPLA